MGRSFRSRPKKLAAKLKLIRTRLGLTQAQMIEKLKVKDEPLRAASISAYEKNHREPPLLVLLQYARIYGCTMEELVDDKLKLPEKSFSTSFEMDSNNSVVSKRRPHVKQYSSDSSGDTSR